MCKTLTTTVTASKRQFVPEHYKQFEHVFGELLNIIIPSMFKELCFSFADPISISLQS